jgi:putative membrane protein
MIHSRSLLLAVAACTALAATTASAASDKAFLTKAMKGDNSEMTFGEIAAQKGESPGVRDFGRMLHTDHAKAKSEVVPIARAHDVPITDEMAPEAKAEKVKLDGLSGAAFDREFASYMVDDHKKDIADFQRQAKMGDPATAKLARMQLPTLHKHLMVAEQLAK